MDTQFRRFFGVVPRTVSALPAVLIALVSVGYGGQEREVRWRPPEIALDIILPELPQPRVRFAGGGLIRRESLKIIDPTAAGDFTAVDVQARAEGDSMTVRLSIIYNDISNQEWWKDKKERVVGTWVIQRGESVSPSELAAFGIEPFELKVIDAKPVVFKPGEGPRIINKTTALEVAHLEKQLDQCRISLRNTSNKNVVAYSIFWGRTGTGARGRSLADTVIAAGAVGPENSLQCSEQDRDSLTISNVIFEDGTFDGDPKFATQFLVNMEGVGIQAPHVLRRIEQTLAADDGDLRAAFDKLEAELWLIPEAIDKQSALELLAQKFPELDQKMVSELYESLKGGLYDARNIALSDLGQTQRSVRVLEERGQSGSAVELMRRVLERLKETFEKITSLHH